MIFDLVVATNCKETLESNLCSSPGLNSNARMLPQTGFESASIAYNTGLKCAESNFVIFAHQDVYFPPGWFDKLRRKLAALESRHPNWAVVGTYGVSTNGERCGHVYTNGLGKKLGSAFEAPVSAQSIDELLIILKRSSGLSFDENLPGFHLYGTDICQAAIEQGLGAYITDLFCIHNSRSIAYLGPDFWQSCAYIRSKWKDRLPIVTPCTVIKRSDFYPLKILAHRLRGFFKRNKLIKANPNPASLAPHSY